MNTSILLVFILTSLAVCNGIFFGFFSRKWNGLKVTCGLNPFNSYTFDSLPRTVDAAINDGFVKISDCGAKFRGNRYIKDGDHAVVLLYDTQGFIAGIQTGIPEGQSDGYPFPGIKSPFVKENGFHYITAYFVDPRIICTTGRTYRQFRDQGTGTDLYIQNGTNPETDSFKVPKLQTELQGTKWTEGKCFPSMGRHYWYDLSANSDCQKQYPVFLMYNDGRLNSFGWAFTTSLTSQRYEHPTPSYFGTFMKQVPRCLYNMGTMSTMHIYLTSTPRMNLC
ncbi:uncharacterized protein LOC126812282 [Patella vulgata]|uniref:uncharacterized protein LOC126812282 n=1 Tax=Patella vulgata TaxID=6465 RepID=UPI00217F7F96|nr:uncharacterized protein LOC126812282 [Patella vulgata]